MTVCRGRYAVACMLVVGLAATITGTAASAATYSPPEPSLPFNALAGGYADAYRPADDPGTNNFTPPPGVVATAGGGEATDNSAGTGGVVSTTPPVIVATMVPDVPSASTEAPVLQTAAPVVPVKVPVATQAPVLPVATQAPVLPVATPALPVATQAPARPQQPTATKACATYDMTKSTACPYALRRGDLNCDCDTSCAKKQCGAEGCGQCKQGFWQLGPDYWCNTCNGMPGCALCTDYVGCGHCRPGFKRVYDAVCGYWMCEGADVLTDCKHTVTENQMCGGTYHTGDTCCAGSLECKYFSQWVSQCTTR